MKIFSPFSIFEQLALALKNRVFPEIFHCIDYILFTFRIFEQLALVLKTEFALKFLTVLKYFLSFRNFEQLAVVLKTGLALKFFKPGGPAALPPPPCLVRLWAYGIDYRG